MAGPASAVVTFEWATVGNPGNVPDPLNAVSIPGIGSVANDYCIAKHEVTVPQVSTPYCLLPREWSARLKQLFAKK